MKKGGGGISTWYTGLNFNCTAALAPHGLQFRSKLYTNVWDAILCRNAVYPSILEAVTLPMKFYLIFFYSGNFQFHLFIIGGVIFIQEILLHCWHQGGP